MRQILSPWLLLTLLVPACAHRSQESSTVRDSDSQECAGEQTSFVLNALPNMNDPLLPKLAFPPFGTFEFTPVAPDATNALQLNICVVSDDDIRLQSIKYLFFGRMMTLDIGHNAKVRGLSKALFGDPSKFLLHVPIPSDIPSIGDNYLAKGFSKNGVSYVAATETYLRDGSDFPWDDRVMIGQLQPGSATFPDQGPCKAGESYHEDHFKIGSGEFFAKSCQNPTPDRSIAVRLLEVSVSDANEHAPPNFIAKFDKPEDLEGPNAPCRYDWSHHNMNDSFHCFTEAAKYSATKSGFFGNSKVKFKVVYADAHAEDSLSPCKDILTCEE